MKKLFELVFIIFFSIQLNAENGCIPEFSVDSFKIELKKIQYYDFDEAKKEAIETLFQKCLTSLQVKQLLQELKFELNSIKGKEAALVQELQDNIPDVVDSKTFLKE